MSLLAKRFLTGIIFIALSIAGIASHVVDKMNPENANFVAFLFGLSFIIGIFFLILASAWELYVDE